MTEKKLRIQQQFLAYNNWKAEIILSLEEYRQWLVKLEMLNPEVDTRIEKNLQSLINDRLTIAFVAEVSRGKTELINAIFFSEFGTRLLPSTAGRTTMCPTEIFYDTIRNKSYVSLLPIETRIQDRTLADFKNDHSQWQHYPMGRESVQEVAQTKRVSRKEACKLGLYSKELYPHRKTAPAYIDIPKWRHALISFPHPLLKQGLTILDTPGLNAIGSEPELTLSMLSTAQAVLFVLAADTGVTRSDMKMWQHHINVTKRNHQHSLVVTLNKIDTLWDELRDEKSIRQAIENKRTSTSRILGINKNIIFPISAQKGLLAKIRNNNELLKRSALLELENHLSRDVLKAKKQLLFDTVSADVDVMLKNSHCLVTANMNEAKKQLEELRDLRGKSSKVIKRLMDKTREEQMQCRRNLESYQASSKEFETHVKMLSSALDMSRLDQKIKDSHREMTGTWTTYGLRISMENLFKEMRQTMQEVFARSEKTRKLLRSIYRKFQNEPGFINLQPRMFSILKYRVELESLFKDAERFRNSTRMAMTEHSFVIKQFFVVIVSKTREIFFHALKETEAWLSNALDPLALQIRNNKDMAEQRFNNLQKIYRFRHTLQSRIEGLQSQYTKLSSQLISLRNIHNNLQPAQQLATFDGSAQPAVVSMLYQPVNQYPHIQTVQP